MDMKDLDKKLIGKEISGCEILSKIATGGMGSVYKARHKALDRIVCVKILSPALTEDKKAVSLFLTEARAIAELDHPNIVNVYNVGKEDGLYFIVMSFINGDTVSNIVKRRPRLPIGFVADTFIGVLKGLGAAHEKGIIHRDIKPSNILINEKLEPKIVDFGIATKMDKDKASTKTTEMAGTAYFISPEQAMGKTIDARADLYSAGASLYFMLTGKYPYTGKTAVEIIQKHLNEKVPSPVDERSETPAWLNIAVQKLMAKKPEDRFQSAAATADYFIKMRAEDRNRVNLGTDSTLNISAEMGMKVRDSAHDDKEDSQITLPSHSHVGLERVKGKKQSAGAGPELPVVDFGVKPVAGDKPVIKARSFNEVRDLKIAEEPAGKDYSSFSGSSVVKKFFFHLPFFLIFSLFSAFVFANYGKMVREGYNFQQETPAALGAAAEKQIAYYNEIITGFNKEHPEFSAPPAGEEPPAAAPASAAQKAAAAPEESAPVSLGMALKAVADGNMPETQVYLSIICGVFIIVLITLFSFPKYKAAAFWLLFVYLFGYFAGFFGIGDMSALSAGISANLFTADYSIIYFIAFMIFASGLFFTGGGSLASRILVMLAVVFAVLCLFKAAAMPVPPVKESMFPVIRNVAFLLITVCLFYVFFKRHFAGRAAPLFLIALSMFLLWSYQVSGVAAAEINHTMSVVEFIKSGKSSKLPKEKDSKPAKPTVKPQDAAPGGLLGSGSVAGKDAGAMAARLEERETDEKVSKALKSKGGVQYLLFVYLKDGERNMRVEAWKKALVSPVNRALSGSTDTLLFQFGFIFMLLCANICFILNLVFGDD